MSLPYIQSTMANVRAGGDSSITYPFLKEGDAATKVYSMACSQLVDDYSSSQLDMDDPMASAAAAGVIALPFAADPSAYFIGDTGHSASDGGMVNFTRKFANIPAPTAMTTGTQIYSFPGWSITWGAYALLLSITGASHSYPSNIVTLSISGDHSITGGDEVFIHLEYTLTGSSFVHQLSGRFRVISTPSGSTITVDLGLIFLTPKTIAVHSGDIIEITTSSRPSKSMSSPTITESTYILPGVTTGISSLSDISMPPLFEVFNHQTGTTTNITQDVYFTIKSTVPSRTQYLQMINDKANLVVETSITKWMGNIHKQEIKTIRAL